MSIKYCKINTRNRELEIEKKFLLLNLYKIMWWLGLQGQNIILGYNDGLSQLVVICEYNSLTSITGQQRTEVAHPPKQLIHFIYHFTVCAHHRKYTFLLDRGWSASVRAQISKKQWGKHCKQRESNTIVKTGLLLATCNYRSVFHEIC